MNNHAESAKLVSVPAEIFSALHGALIQDDSGNGATTLRRIGVKAGKSLVGTLQGKLASTGGRLEHSASDTFWEEMDGVFRDLGWGGIKHERLHPGVISLASSDWFEATDESPHPCCHFTVGVLGEVIRQIASQEVAVMEVECRSAGDDRCRFLLGNGEALTAVYGHMAEGGSYQDGVAALD